jgi:hypothetical protein
MTVASKSILKQVITYTQIPQTLTMLDVTSKFCTVSQIMILTDNMYNHNLYLYQTDMYSSTGSLVTATKPKKQGTFSQNYYVYI